MSQASVYAFLSAKSNRRKWFSNKQISAETGDSVASVTSSTQKLFSSNFIESRTVKNGNYTKLEFRVR